MIDWENSSKKGAFWSAYGFFGRQSVICRKACKEQAFLPKNCKNSEQFFAKNAVLALKNFATADCGACLTAFEILLLP